jgi:DNA polymerase III subunit alpha
VTYQTAYLKANYPVEFMAASMTYESGSTDKLAQFVGEAKKFGITVLPPDINASEVMFSVERKEGSKPAIRYALAAIKNVGAAAMAGIVAERRANGPFSDIHDFASRVDASVMNRRQLEYLTMAGVFDSLNPNRRQVYESLDMLIATAQNATVERSSTQVSLFGGEASQSMNRRALKTVEEWKLLEKLNHECSAVGFYLSAHPLTPYEPVFKKLGISPSSRLTEHFADKFKLKLAGILTSTKMRSSPRGRSAFLNLSDSHGQYEVAVFDEYLLNQHHALLKNGTALMLGIDVRQSERGQRLLVTRIEPLEEVSQTVRASTLTVKVEDIAACGIVARVCCSMISLSISGGRMRARGPPLFCRSAMFIALKLSCFSFSIFRSAPSCATSCFSLSVFSVGKVMRRAFGSIDAIFLASMAIPSVGRSRTILWGLLMPETFTAMSALSAMTAINSVGEL